MSCNIDEPERGRAITKWVDTAVYFGCLHLKYDPYTISGILQVAWVEVLVLRIVFQSMILEVSWIVDLNIQPFGSYRTSSTDFSTHISNFFYFHPSKRPVGDINRSGFTIIRLKPAVLNKCRISSRW